MIYRTPSRGTNVIGVSRTRNYAKTDQMIDTMGIVAGSTTMRLEVASPDRSRRDVDEMQVVSLPAKVPIKRWMRVHRIIYEKIISCNNKYGESL